MCRRSGPSRTSCLPQFREFKLPVTGNEFSITCFSELGCPSYFCFFCRSATTDILQQPLIKTLSIFNVTTQKKSNSIQDISIGQLFHLTQRNVHKAAEYSRAAFKRRQTVLLSAEDVGMMGLRSFEYQKAKRVQYRFSGTTDRPGQRSCQRPRNAGRTRATAAQKYWMTLS